MHFIAEYVECCPVYNCCSNLVARAAVIYIARTQQYSLCGHWATVVCSGVRYELTYMLRLNKTDRV